MSLANMNKTKRKEKKRNVNLSGVYANFKVCPTVDVDSHLLQLSVDLRCVQVDPCRFAMDEADRSPSSLLTLLPKCMITTIVDFFCM